MHLICMHCSGRCSKCHCAPVQRQIHAFSPIVGCDILSRCKVYMVALFKRSINEIKGSFYVDIFCRRSYEGLRR